MIDKHVSIRDLARDLTTVASTEGDTPKIHSIVFGCLMLAYRLGLQDATRLTDIVNREPVWPTQNK